MSLQELASPAIIGSFYDKLETMDIGWAGLLGGNKSKGGKPYASTQESETYKFLGLTAGLRQWIGGRVSKPLWVFGQTVLNKPYELTIPVLDEELRRDKTDQIQERLDTMGDNAVDHWNELLSTLINDAATTTGFDGQYFFDSDHTWGNNSTSQDNDIGVDISAEPAQVHGDTTAPSPEEAMWTVVHAIETLMGFKDNENKPLNVGAQKFLVQVVPSLAGAFAAGISGLNQYNVQGDVLGSAGWDVQLSVNPRLTSATAVAYVYRLDGPAGPFIIQEELAPEFATLGKGSDHNFFHREQLFGIHAWRGADYGLWYKAVKATMT